jgi:L-fucose isomerase-like protein
MSVHESRRAAASAPAAPYPVEHAPKLGVVSNATGDFSERGKSHNEALLRALFEQLLREGTIRKDSLLYDRRIFGYHEASAAAQALAAAQVEVLLVYNAGFPNGFVVPVVGMHPALQRLPLIVAASVEPNAAIGSREWVTNTICGNDMNNYVARYVGRQARFLDGSPESPVLRGELRMLLNAFHAVRRLRADYLGRFGDAPGGFHSASGDQLLFFKTFGTIVDTVDLIRVLEVYESMQTSGQKGKQSFSEAEIQETLREMTRGRLNLIGDQQILYRGARLYHALRAIIRAEGFTSAAFKCWPEITASRLKVTPCLSLSWAMAKGDVTAFACESDWPMAVAQSLGTMLSGRPAAFLDFVDETPGASVLRLGHCGVGIAGCMVPSDPGLLAQADQQGRVPESLKVRVLSGEQAVTDALIEHGVSRQVGSEIGPTHIGQFEYGPKTGICLHKTPEGRLKMLVFTGESRPDTAQGILYSGSDVQIRSPEALYALKREHGFPHHLAVALGDVSRELRELCAFYGIEYVSPDG